MARSRSNSQSSSSSSGSSSSSSSGSSSSDSATPLSQARPKQAKAPAPIRLGEIPEGYHPTHFPKSNFDHSKVSSQQEIWVMKVPTGVSASSLNGVVLNLPNSKSSSSSSASKPIATFKAPTTFASSLSSEAEFHLHLTQPDSRSEAQAGTAGAETQLITMAGGAKAAEDAEKAQKRANGGAGLISGGGRELHGVNVFLSSGEGRGKMARIDESAIRRAHLVLAPPSNSTVRAITADSGEGPQAESAATQAAEAQGLETGHKRKREQPWNRMSGFFHPSGSITKDSPASLPNPKTEVEASTSGSQPPEKKLKKDEKSSTENKEKKDKKDKKDKKEKKAKKSKKDK